MLFNMWCTICEESSMSPIHIVLEYPDGHKMLYKYFASEPDNKLQLSISPCETVPDTYTMIARMFEKDVAKVAKVCSLPQLTERMKSPKDWVNKIIVKLCTKELVNIEAEILWRHLLGAELHSYQVN
ncbi:hypothetical protein NHJ13051_001557 [Beauveria bassiana]|uniref:Uncharacterized protein n=1 Tax=Beauveria bassiana TaxID=176275 RepID=A0A2N6NWX8_BEABA|nr:hypothetical protein BM221_001864 [Beauveria bassiana]